MTGNDIKSKISRYVGKEPDDDIVLDAIEDAINKLGNMGYIIDTIAFEGAEKNEFYKLPKDLIRIVKVEKLNEDKYYLNYLVDGIRIRFGDDGDYRIFAEKHPQQLDSLNDEIEMHPMLQNCVKNYAIGYVKVSIDDTSEDGHRLKEQFMQYAERAYRTLKRNEKTPSKIRVERNA